MELRGDFQVTPTSGAERILRMWHSRWGLSRDPFGAADADYVRLGTHEEAIETLRFEIEGSAVVTVFGQGGLGKSSIVREFLKRSDAGRRRLSLTDVGGVEGMASRLLERSGYSAANNTRRSPEGRLSELCRLNRRLGRPLLAAIETAFDAAEADTVGRIVTLTDPASRVVIVRREPEDGERISSERVAVEVRALTRSEVATYLAARLGRAGGRVDLFSPKAVTRIHQVSGGNPSTVNRVAASTLRSASETEAIGEGDVADLVREDLSGWRRDLGMCYDRIR